MCNSYNKTFNLSTLRHYLHPFLIPSYITRITPDKIQSKFTNHRKQKTYSVSLLNFMIAMEIRGNILSPRHFKLK